ncbi:Hypothetical predicted protein [Paramuricea clavata]|uniref:Uncharacterized protein n=1 Tax=Paramuricea clavata TaxID=317549 RepID=A0A6S7JDL0_PARCT|nr:Hypothetical predicted protein [Paramuricea clavata]
MARLFEDLGKIMVESWEDCPRSWWNLSKIVQDHGGILARMSRSITILPRFYYTLAKIVIRSFFSKDHGGILTRSSNILTRLQYRILALDFGKILARSWWNLAKIVQDHGN